jgi:hypothetical protein
MGRYALFILTLLFCLLLGVGCSSHQGDSNPVRKGAKANLTHFFQQPFSYRGKILTLSLKVEEDIDREQNQSLRQYTNRYVKFRAEAKKGEPHHLMIRIPQNIPIPDAAKGDEVVVTFLCSRGNLEQGNEATAIEKH